MGQSSLGYLATMKSILALLATALPLTIADLGFFGEVHGPDFHGLRPGGPHHLPYHHSDPYHHHPPPPPHHSDPYHHHPPPPHHDDPYLHHPPPPPHHDDPYLHHPPPPPPHHDHPYLALYCLTLPHLAS